jgi:hypothetical protein
MFATFVKKSGHAQWLLACGSKVPFRSLLPVLRPAGRKTGNKKMVSTALPKAKNADCVSPVK